MSMTSVRVGHAKMRVSSFAKVQNSAHDQIEYDANPSRDHHCICINFNVIVYNTQDGHVDKNSGQEPNDNDTKKRLKLIKMLK
jgi:hypothetical protein